MRQLLPTSFISTCNASVTLEKCAVRSANTDIVPEDFGNFILLTVTSNYNKTLTITASPRELYLHICIFGVLEIYLLPCLYIYPAFCWAVLIECHDPTEGKSALPVAWNLIHTDLCGGYATVPIFMLIRSQKASTLIQTMVIYCKCFSTVFPVKSWHVDADAIESP